MVPVSVNVEMALTNEFPAYVASKADAITKVQTQRGHPRRSPCLIRVKAAIYKLVPTRRLQETNHERIQPKNQ